MSQGRIFYEKPFSGFHAWAFSAQSEVNCTGALLLCEKKDRQCQKI